MKTVYIDYINSVSTHAYKGWSKHLVVKKQYHGGGNYTNTLLLDLQKRYEEYNLVLLWAKGYIPQMDCEKSFYEDGRFIIQEIESLSSIPYLEQGSTLFLPSLHRIEDYIAVSKIKSANPTVKIVSAIHDLRMKFNKYEMLSRYYFSGWKYYLFFLQKPGFWAINTLLNRYPIKKGIQSIDIIITPSNYSMQNIVKYKINGDIVLHYQSALPKSSTDTRSPKDNYFLFVSGNRPAKNFLRTLEAFCIFKKSDKQDYFLNVTGLDEKELNNLLRYKKIDRQIVERWVRALGYVDFKTLDNLYLNCNLLLFTSKYEGFGLPLLEAARYGRPTLSSFASSIPEVLGCFTHYVDPYNVQSIVRGMDYMIQEHIMNQYERWMAAYYPVLQQKSEQDLAVILSHILD